MALDWLETPFGERGRVYPLVYRGSGGSGECTAGVLVTYNSNFSPPGSEPVISPLVRCLLSQGSVTDDSRRVESGASATVLDLVPATGAGGGYQRIGRQLVDGGQQDE